MGRLWWLLLLPLVACGGRGDGVDLDRALSDVQESAVAAFVSGRAERGLPSAPLEFRAGGIYSAPPGASGDPSRVWQVRSPRADAIVLPLDARDRLAGVELKVDVQVRFEDRSCELASNPGAPGRCQPWQEATCCNRIWKRKRGEWLVELPR